MSFFDWFRRKPAPVPVAEGHDIALAPALTHSDINASLPSTNCIKLIQQQEGLLFTAQQDVDGVWVNGYGCKIISGKPAYKGQVITKEVAVQSCLTHAFECAKAVLEVVNHPLTQGQLDALVDFVYNCGIGALKQSTLLRTFNAYQSVSERLFTMWSKAHVDGQVVELPGLLARRKAEYQLWIN